MLNIHLNGEVVLTPDFLNIQKRLIEQRLNQCRCKYNFEELKCPGWYNYCHNKDEIKPISKFGRCFLSGCDSCPMHVERKTNGLMKKNYGIDNRQFRKMQSASHYLIKKSEHKILFITLTFPQFHKYLSPNEANKLFSQFVENLRRRHGCEGYIAVRENGSKFGRLHYHLLISMPFVSFPDLNSYWCDIISDYCSFAPNALQTDPKTKFIKNPVRAMYYVSKYFSKTGATKSESRVVFISRNLLSTKIVDYYDRITKVPTYKTISNIKKTFNYSETPINDLFDRYPSLVVTYQSEYTTGFKITTAKEFNRFCDDFLYKIFDLPSESPELITSFN
jgi:hypothetical protein